MASDIKLNENAVVVEGNVGVGTSTPIRMLHVEGSEIHSGGPAGGFSFADRTKGNAERWVWYSSDQKARLWAQSTSQDVLTVTPDGVVGVRVSDPPPTRALWVRGGARVYGDVTVGGEGKGGGNELDVVGKVTTEGLNAGYQFFDTVAGGAKKWTWSAIDGSARLRSQESQKDTIVVSPAGNVTISGALSQASSIALKENVAELSGREAIETLRGLNPVKFSYKADPQKEQNIGFIAEDVPDLVTNAERDRIALMNIMAVLTKAVQEQQQTIAELVVQVNTIKQRNRADPDPGCTAVRIGPC